MNTQELMNRIVDVHNMIADIKVNGDDAIRMGAALSGLRTIAKDLNKTVGGEKESFAEE